MKPTSVLLAASYVIPATAFATRSRHTFLTCKPCATNVVSYCGICTSSSSSTAPCKCGMCKSSSARCKCTGRCMCTARFMSTSSAMDVVKSEIACNHVTVFSKTYCPHCTATKALFADLKVPVKIHELDVLPDGAAMQAALLELTGQRTVPNVFINGKHLGGNDKTQAANKSGLLAELLAAKN